MRWRCGERVVLREMGGSVGRVLWPSRKWGVHSETGDPTGRWLAL